MISVPRVFAKSAQYRAEIHAASALGNASGRCSSDWACQARMAALAPSPADEATWLKLAAEWLAMEPQRRRAGTDWLDASSTKEHKGGHLTTCSSDYLSGLPVARPTARSLPRTSSTTIGAVSPTACSPMHSTSIPPWVARARRNGKFGNAASRRSSQSGR